MSPKNGRLAILLPSLHIRNHLLFSSSSFVSLFFDCIMHKVASSWNRPHRQQSTNTTMVTSLLFYSTFSFDVLIHFLLPPYLSPLRSLCMSMHSSKIRQRAYAHHFVVPTMVQNYFVDKNTFIFACTRLPRCFSIWQMWMGCALF